GLSICRGAALGLPGGCHLPVVGLWSSDDLLEVVLGWAGVGAVGPESQGEQAAGELVGPAFGRACASSGAVGAQQPGAGAALGGVGTPFGGPVFDGGERRWS